MRGLVIAARALALSIPLALTACGGDDGTGGGDDPPVEDDGKYVSFETPEFEVAAGDTFTCFYLDQFTDRELAVVNSTGQQGLGGHHILVMYSEEPRDVGYHECSDEEMTNLKQISGSAGQDASAAEGSILGLPPGLALKVPAGKQLVLQAHYINTTGAPMKVKDKVRLELGDPAKVKAYVNYLVTLDEAFKVPPQAEFTSTTTCTLDRDFDFALVLGHMHEQGKHYTLEVIDEAGKSLQKLRDDAWLPSYTSHPPVGYYTMEEPLHLSKGTKIRQTCSWNNTTAEPLLFPREMCLAFFYYFPGDGDLICEMEPELVGGAE